MQINHSINKCAIISHWNKKYSMLRIVLLCFALGVVSLIIFEPSSVFQCSYYRPSEKNESTQIVCEQNWFKEDNTTILLPMTEAMKNIVDNQRINIQEEMKEFKYSSKIRQKSLGELVPEQNGRPLMSVVVTTWRSGSTFIGGVLDSHPATYHISEPLAQFKTVQIRGEPLATPALRVLKNVLSCNYKSLDDYLSVSKTGQIRLFTHNTRLWKSCEKQKDLCFLPQFLTPMCKLFPFLSMKTVHLRLRLIESLITDKELNLKVIYLVRDPRGTIRSRHVQPWCKQKPDCGDPTRLCADLIDDYAATLRFKQLYPSKFRVVRYEDLSLNPNKVIPEMFDFLGLYYAPRVNDFVKKHTTKNNSHAYFTYRDSSIVPLMWRKKLSFDKVSEIQKKCSIAMAAWGYLPVDKASNLKTFNPLLQPFDLPPT